MFDTKTETIINNELSWVLVALDDWPVVVDGEPVDLYPDNLEDDIQKNID